MIAPENGLDEGDGLAAELCGGLRWVVPQEDGSWRPGGEDDAGAVYAALLPLRRPMDTAIVDAVAWELVGEGAPWWRRTGEITFLGALQLEEAMWRKVPVPLVATPREWMHDVRHESVCILDWRIDVAELFARVDAVDCQGNASLRSTLNAALRRQSLRVL